MQKIINWLKANKIILILVFLIFFLFSITLLLLNNNYVNSLKEERNQIKKEKEILLKQISSLNDSITFYEKLSKEFILKDTVIINQIVKEKQKTNVEISNIPNLSVDSNQLLFSKLINEYIQTGFVKDSTH